MCHNNSHHLLKYILVICLASILISVKYLKFASKWSISYFYPILAAIFVTMEMVKVESIPDFNTLAIVLIN